MEFDAFTSDPHYYHAKIIEYCDRPFSSAFEMNETLICNYNDLIGKNDRVLWLGDTLMGSTEKGKQILSRLNGKKYLCLGNHDLAAHKMCSMGFELASHRMFFNMAGRKIVANHFDQWKMRSIWDDRFENLRYKIESDEILLHGHTHQKSKYLLNQVHLGVDAWDFRPAMREEVELIVREKISSSYSSKEFQHKEEVFFEYRDLMRQKKAGALGVEEKLNNSRYDSCKELGWDKETKSRQK